PKARLPADFLDLKVRSREKPCALGQPNPTMKVPPRQLCLSEQLPGQPGAIGVERTSPGRLRPNQLVTRHHLTTPTQLTRGRVRCHQETEGDIAAASEIADTVSLGDIAQ